MELADLLERIRRDQADVFQTRRAYVLAQRAKGWRQRLDKRKAAYDRLNQAIADTWLRQITLR